MSQLPVIVTWKYLLDIAMTAFISAPNIEGPHHGPGSWEKNAKLVASRSLTLIEEMDR